MRFLCLVTFVLFAACGGTTPTPDAATPLDAGSSDDAGLDAGLQVPTVDIGHSLFWNDAGVLDDQSVVSFSRLMALASADGHGGALLAQWFHRFATTAHSERALPAQFVDAVAVSQGADPRQWDLSQLPFKVTGLHNRIDLARLEAGGHCGELRASVSCTDPTLQPFHALFLFRQPLAEGDVVGGRVTCEGTARRWAHLSELTSPEFEVELRRMLAQGMTHERFLMIETVEFTLAPWEWRQWLPGADGGVDNPPLFQQVDVETINQTGPLRTDFLGWVDANAEQLAARRLEIPERFRPQSTRVTQGLSARVPLILTSPAQFPTLRQQLELVGCAACHTTDADFVQTHSDRTVSPFYEKELRARASHLERLARGEAVRAPFGPLQIDPKLPE